MLLLAVDTSSRQGSIALAAGDSRPGSGDFHLLEVVPLAGGSYSARLIPELSALLARHGFRKQDLEGFAVVAGPGSFTGLRVGLAAVKGLAEILRRPIASVSMLEAIAAHAGGAGRVIAALDAGRKEIYAGEYHVAAAGRSGECVRESLLGQAEFRLLLELNAGAELITPDPEVCELAGTHLRVCRVDFPNAAEIARLGLEKIRAGTLVPPDLLEANYIRRSDAEIFGSL
jgi:tRNA threonylcarbamoyladenosine biosynthesis protein TsaB